VDQELLTLSEHHTPRFNGVIYVVIFFEKGHSSKHYYFLDQNLTKSERVEDTFVRSLKSERTDNTKTNHAGIRYFCMIYIVCNLYIIYIVLFRHYLGQTSVGYQSLRLIIINKQLYKM
jgi:hypothetical protein